MSWEGAHRGNADVRCGLEIRWIGDGVNTGMMMVLSSRRNFVDAGFSADGVVPIRVSS